MKKPLPPTYVAISIATMLALHFLAPVELLLSYPWRLAGLLPLAVGFALNIAADRAFKRYDTTVKPFQRSSCLIAGGVFRFTRNPMYLGMVLSVAGIAMLLGSLTPWIVVPVLAVLLQRNFIAIEERMLEETFGAPFADYAKHVRRWL